MVVATARTWSPPQSAFADRFCWFWPASEPSAVANARGGDAGDEPDVGAVESEHLQREEWRLEAQSGHGPRPSERGLDGCLAHLVFRDRVELADTASVCHRPEELLDILDRARNPPTPDAPRRR